MDDAAELSQDLRRADGRWVAMTEDAYGDYRVQRVLGQGAMGMVYRAYDPRLDRMVALKLVHPARIAKDAVRARARLIAEARALACVSHPNVLAVYDIGEHDDVVYVALELVDGVDLATWLRTAPRSWRVVVDVFVEIAAGLAAVHAVGLVHRDVKPANILMEPAPAGGRTGRVLVADFGIARATTVHAPTLPDDVDLGSSDDGLPLTEAGRVVGTPAYMAPEQHLARTVGPAADQYALCVALYEALYGRRPFLGPVQSMLRAKTSPPARPPASEVPQWLWTIVRRGLAWSPDDRFATMDEFAAALRRGPRTRRLGALMGTTAAVAIAATAIIGAVQKPPCDGAGERIAGIWNAARRSSIGAAFAASDREHARQTWTAVAKRFDAYAGELAATYRDACEATFVRREQAEGVYDRRMVCLDRREQELGQSLALLDAGDADLVDHAYDVVSSLGEIAACSDLAALEAGIEPPAPGQRRAVADVRRIIADAGALQAAGRYDDASRTIADAVVLARAVEYPHAIVEALVHAAELHERQSRVDEARVALDEAINTGLEIGSDALVLRALVLRTWIAAEYERDVDAAQEWAALGRAQLARVGDPLEQALGLHNALGTAYSAAGRYTEARAEYEQALALVESDPAEREWAATLHSNLGGVHYLLGDLDRAAGSFARALELHRAQLGDDHPTVAYSGLRLAQVLGQRGRHAEAIAALREVVASLERMQATPTEVATALTSLGTALRNSGADDEPSTTYMRAIDLLTDSGDDVTLAWALVSHGQSCIDRGVYDAAETQFRRAIALLERVDPSGENLAIAWTGLGRIRERQARPDDALSFHRRAYEVAPQTRAAARAYAASAVLLATAGRHDAAIVALERQDAILAGVPMLFPNDRLIAAMAHVRVATASGQAPAATERLDVLDDLLAQARSSGGTRLSGEAELTIGHARLRRGERSLAIAALERAVAELDETRGPDLAQQARDALAEAESAASASSDTRRSP